MAVKFSFIAYNFFIVYQVIIEANQNSDSSVKHLYRKLF